jgi:hypothetical protein
MMPIVAETIDRVEYQLPPKIAQQWELKNKIENENGKALIYLPKGCTRQNTKEFFGVNVNKFSSNLDNILAFKLSMAKQFPNKQVDVEILEKGKNNLLYEYKVMEKGQERIHGLGRVFSIGDRTIVLGYQTDDISHVAQARMDWFPVLKQAKSMQ